MNMARKWPAGTPVSDREDHQHSYHPNGAGWYAVVMVRFREDSDIYQQCKVNVGITCKEQLAGSGNEISMWPSAVMQVALNNAGSTENWDSGYSATGVWAEASEEADLQMEQNELESQGAEEAD